MKCFSEEPSIEHVNFVSTEKYTYVKKDHDDVRFGFVDILGSQLAEGLVFSKKKLIGRDEEELWRSQEVVERHVRSIENRINKINHPNILRCFDYATHDSTDEIDSDVILTVMYEWPRSDLWLVINQYKEGGDNIFIPPTVMMNIATSCINALCHLQSLD